jgi:hypothetical protein
LPPRGFFSPLDCLGTDLRQKDAVQSKHRVGERKFTSLCAKGGGKRDLYLFDGQEPKNGTEEKNPLGGRKSCRLGKAD